MELNVYSIYDSKALAYGTPFFSPTDGLAIRMFADLANDSNSSVYHHSDDFKLYRIGKFVSDSAVLNAELPTYLACGVDFITPTYNTDTPVVIHHVSQPGTAEITD